VDSGESSGTPQISDALIEDFVTRLTDLDDHLKYDTSPEAVGAWLQHMNVEPEELVDIIHRDIPVSMQTSFNLSKDGDGNFECQMQERQNRAGMASRTFDIPNKFVVHELFELARTHRGQGLGRTFIRNWVHIYLEHWQIENVLVLAGLSHGGYVWLRYGFVPDQNSWEALRSTVRRRLIEKMAEIDNVVFDIASDTLEKDDPQSAWIIADLAEPIDGQSLGRYLLKDTKWSGELDLTDEVALNRLLRYVGELK